MSLIDFTTWIWFGSVYPSISLPPQSLRWTGHLTGFIGTERLPGVWYFQFLFKARQSQAKQDKVSALTSSPYHLWLACCVFTISFLNWSACYSPIFLLQVSNAPLHPPLCNSTALSKILILFSCLENQALPPSWESLTRELYLDLINIWLCAMACSVIFYISSMYDLQINQVNSNKV